MVSTSKNSKSEFEAQLTAALMLQTNALVSIKTVTKLCSLSRQEIDRRVYNGTFPKPQKLSKQDNAIRKAFRLHDIQIWLDDPHNYQQ
ncbi:helix-turn-helix transcriptional regulator [Agarilytica rhodophyticola]|uniref:helix-turn-helix transcriptional regulator n=1 Tax=Agarilytica rhodophyticola TaxID=1737490 RepID=UPI000B347631|nr:AlpA family phage regulatory protein [Agarilytica rhodophyticola]